MKITVVVCTHNRYDVLPDAMGSLREQTLRAEEIEVLVVDNSTDLKQQKEFWADFDTADNVRLIYEGVPGLSRARNIGVREARAPVVAFMDDDALASPAWCESLVHVFAEHADAGIAGGPVEPIWKSPRPNWLHRYQEGFFTIVDRGEALRRLEKHEWLAGTNIAFRRSLMEGTGGFSEGLGRIKGTLLSNEELAIAQKIHETGYFSYYDPRARMLHRVHSDRVSQNWLRRRVAWQAVSDLLAEPQACDADARWSRIADYLYALPPEMRGMRGLFLDTQDPELFQKQCQAIEAALHLLLNHGRDPMESAG